MVAAQLVEWSPQTSEIHGSNPGSPLTNICLLFNVLKRKKKKEGGNGIFLKKKILIVLLRVGAERSRWTNPAQRTDDLRRRAKQGFGSGQLQPLPVVGLRRPELPARKLRIRQGRVRVRAQLPRWTGLRQKLF